MHGRRRDQLPVLSAEKQEEQRNKIRLAFALLQRLLTQRSSGVHSPEILQATRKLIEFHPELATVWNYRKEVLNKLLSQQQQQQQEQQLQQQQQQQQGHTSKTSDSNNSNPGSPSSTSTSSSNSTSSSSSSSNSSNNSTDLTENASLCALLQEELQLTTSLVARGNSKSYCLWLHRSWALGRLLQLQLQPLLQYLKAEQTLPLKHKPKQQQEQQQQQQEEQQQQEQEEAAAAAAVVEGLSLLQSELNACDLLLQQQDNRNFHCWQHRTMIFIWESALEALNAKLFNKAPKQQNACNVSLGVRSDCAVGLFCLSLIENDFSCYSAWHYRCLHEKNINIKEELSLLWRGLYTDPTDQSLWVAYWRLLQQQRSAGASSLLSVRLNISQDTSTQLQLEGKWKPLGSLHLTHSSSSSPRLAKVEGPPLSPVWQFELRSPLSLDAAAAPAATAAATPPAACSICLRAHLAVTAQGGPSANISEDVDEFYLHRLYTAAPKLRAILKQPAAAATAAAAAGAAAAAVESGSNDAAKAADEEGKEETKEILQQPPLSWLCYTITPSTNSSSGSSRISLRAAEAATSYPWAISGAVYSRGSSCCCCSPAAAAACNQAPLPSTEAAADAAASTATSESASSAEAGAAAAAALAESAAAVEAAAAAGAKLPPHLSRSMAEEELQRVEEFVQEEPKCYNAYLARSRLLRALRPHDFAALRECVNQLKECDEINPAVYKHEEENCFVRQRVFECLLRGDSGGEEAKEKEETDNSEETSKREETNESEETKAEETSEGPLNFANAQGNNIEETNAKKQNIMETNVKKTNFKKTDVQLSEGGIERLAYPLLLEATNAERLFLSFTKISDASMLDWHVPYLPFLRELFVEGTSISLLSLLLFSVVELPRLERLNAACTKLRPVEEDEALEDTNLKAAICNSALKCIDISCTPLAASLSPSTSICCHFRPNFQKSQEGLRCVLIREEGEASRRDHGDREEMCGV